MSAGSGGGAAPIPVPGDTVADASNNDPINIPNQASGNIQGQSDLTVTSPPAPPAGGGLSPDSSSGIQVVYGSYQNDSLERLNARGGVAAQETTNTASSGTLTWAVTGPTGAGAPVYSETETLIINCSLTGIGTNGAGITALGFAFASTNLIAGIDAAGDLKVTTTGGTVLATAKNFSTQGGGISVTYTTPGPAPAVETVGWAVGLTLVVAPPAQGVTSAASSTLNFSFACNQNG